MTPLLPSKSRTRLEGGLASATEATEGIGASITFLRLGVKKRTWPRPNLRFGWFNLLDSLDYCLAHLAIRLTYMKQIKAALDPQGILNPGKIFP